MNAFVIKISSKENKNLFDCLYFDGYGAFGPKINATQVQKYVEIMLQYSLKSYSVEVYSDSIEPNEVIWCTNLVELAKKVKDFTLYNTVTNTYKRRVRLLIIPYIEGYKFNFTKLDSRIWKLECIKDATKSSVLKYDLDSLNSQLTDAVVAELDKHDNTVKITKIGYRIRNQSIVFYATLETTQITKTPIFA